MVISEVIQKWKRKKFQWGISDCWAFSMDAAECLTGQAMVSPANLRAKTEKELSDSFHGPELRELFRKLFSESGLSKSDGPNQQGSIGIISINRTTPALSVWDGGALWMISSKGLREIDKMLVEEWWEAST